MISFDASLLTNYYSAKSGAAPASGSGSSAFAAATSTSASPTGSPNAPRSPWGYGSGAAQESDLVKKVMAGHRFIDPNAVSLSVAGASPDYTKLFTLYQGLSALEGLATKAQDTKLSSLDLTATKRRFAAGMAEVGSYISDTKFDHVALTEGTLTQELKNSVGVARTNTVYNAPDIHTGSASTSVKAFEGDVKFSMAVKKIGTATPFNVDIDLSEMGTQTRSMSNVVSFINTKLKDQGLQTKFAVKHTAAVPTTTTVGGKTVTLSKGQDSYGLQIKGVTTESLTFSAPVAADSVYVVQTTGDPTKTGTTRTAKDGTKTTTGLPVINSQLLKFQTDSSNGATITDPDAQPSDPISKVGTKYWVAGEAGQVALPDTVSSVQDNGTSPDSINDVLQTAAGPDGSVYVLANVSGTTSGQEIKGVQDVALIKYDSAGKVVFTRTLGASDTASAYTLAVSADGKVAVAGSVTGALNIATTKTTTIGTAPNQVTTTSTTTTSLNGLDNATSDSFVTLYDASGVEQWSQRRGSGKADQATAVAFGSDGSVYVGGKTQALMAGADGSAKGGWDGYVMGFGADGKYQFTTQTGTAQSDSTAGLVVDGNTIYAASVEDGNAVVRTFDVSSSLVSKTTTDAKGQTTTTTSTVYTAAETGVRNLGGIGGGGISGMSLYNGKIYLGGSAGSDKLLSGTGTTTHGYSGSQDAFALSVDADLGDTSHDTIAYYGGAGIEKNAKVQFSNGKAWIAGQTTGDIDGTTKIQSKDAYLARLNIDTGTVEYQKRYSGTDGVVQPSAIAVSTNSSTVLDKLGLPLGKVETKDSPLLISGTSVRAGDQFSLVDPGSGSKKTITIEASDTMETLAKKIIRASSYRLKVEVKKVLGKQLDQLDIKPSNTSSRVEFVSGPVGKDALSGLGLDAGLVSSDASKIMDAKSSNYLRSQKPMGLSFDSSLNLNSAANITDAMKSLQETIKNVQKVYNYLKYGDPQDTGTTKKPGSTGAAPAYLSTQIANYQAGLNRLLGSG